MNEELVENENLVEAEPKKKRRVNFFWLIGIFVILAIAAWFGRDYYYNGPCGVNKVKAAREQMDLIAGEYDNEFDMAAAVFRSQLTGPIETLQSTVQELQDLEIPMCMETARGYFVTAMDDGVQALTLFMDPNNPNSLIEELRIKHNQALDAGVAELGRVLACAPFCK